MITNSPEIKKIVHDYDFIAKEGVILPITIDPSAGDTIEIGETKVVIYLAAKPSLNNPEKSLPAEDHTIFISRLLSIRHSERVVTELTPEEQFEWHKTVKEMSKTIN